MKEYLDSALKTLKEKMADGNATEEEKELYKKYYIEWALRD